MLFPGQPALDYTRRPTTLIGTMRTACAARTASPRWRRRPVRPGRSTSRTCRDGAPAALSTRRGGDRRISRAQSRPRRRADRREEEQPVAAPPRLSIPRRFLSALDYGMSTSRAAPRKCATAGDDPPEGALAIGVQPARLLGARRRRMAAQRVIALAVISAASLPAARRAACRPADRDPRGSIAATRSGLVQGRRRWPTDTTWADRPGALASKRPRPAIGRRPESLGA